jgi:hypothetical protein
MEKIHVEKHKYNGLGIHDLEVENGILYIGEWIYPLSY